MRVRTLPFEGAAEPLDPEDPGPFIALAGSQFVRMEGDAAVVATKAGPAKKRLEMTVYPGWLVIRADGSPDGSAAFTPPENVGTESPCIWGVIS